MSKKGELIFLRTNPQVESSTQFNQDCSTTAGNPELGCYNPNTNRIYILKMPSDLYDEEVATAAYEMLHPVYTSITASDSAQINKAIEDEYNSRTNDSNLVGQVASFAKTEPGSRDEELFSLLGTEHSDLSSNLANYYTPYFTDISKVVGANDQINTVFQNDLNRLNRINIEINNDKNLANTAYSDSISWANAGNQYEDTYNYNIYSRDIDAANAAVDQYNNLLDEYNILVTAINGGQPQSPLQPAQTQ